MTWSDFLDNVPIVGTARRIMADWKGGKWDDYQSCITTTQDCEGLGKAIAAQKCKDCIGNILTSV